MRNVLLLRASKAALHLAVLQPYREIMSVLSSSDRVLRAKIGCRSPIRSSFTRCCCNAAEVTNDSSNSNSNSSPSGWRAKTRAWEKSLLSPNFFATLSKVSLRFLRIWASLSDPSVFLLRLETEGDEESCGSPSGWLDSDIPPEQQTDLQCALKWELSMRIPVKKHTQETLEKGNDGIAHTNSRYRTGRWQPMPIIEEYDFWPMSNWMFSVSRTYRGVEAPSRQKSNLA